MKMWNNISIYFNLEAGNNIQVILNVAREIENPKNSLFLVKMDNSVKFFNTLGLES